MVFDRDKFKRLVHYVIARAGDHDGFGATKLYKVLWYSEAKQFLLTGKPITGAEYIREEHGPVPRLGNAIRKELADEGAIRQWKDRFFNKDSWRLKSLRPPQMHGFTAEELQAVNFWIDCIDKEHTAASISEQSHDYAWEIAKMREPLPLFAQLATRMREPTEEELRRARKIVEELKLA